MSGGTVDRVVAFLNSTKVDVVRMMGGEPTDHPKFQQIVEKLRAATSARLVLCTHGYDLMSRFLPIRDLVDMYILSLDGADGKQYASIRGVDWFKEVVSLPKEIHLYSKRIKVGFTCVIQRKNLSSLHSIYCLAVDSGADTVSFTLPTLNAGTYGNASKRIHKQKRSVWLTESEMTILEGQIEALIECASERCVPILQTDTTLRSYPYVLRKWIAGLAIDLPDAKCQVPSKSMVVDQFGRIKPCFVLPEAWPINTLLNNAESVAFQKRFYENCKTRDECKMCYIYPSTLDEFELDNADG